MRDVPGRRACRTIGAGGIYFWRWSGLTLEDERWGITGVGEAVVPGDANVSVRVADTRDAARLIGLRQRFCEENHLRFLARETKEAFGQLLAEADLGFVCIVDSSQTVAVEGYVVVSFGFSIESGGRDALIDEIAVWPQGHGHGSDLLRFAIELLRKRGIPRIFLETENHQARVRPFYERIGFAREDSTWFSLWL